MSELKFMILAESLIINGSFCNSTSTNNARPKAFIYHRLSAWLQN